ncbi:MAG: class I SAM-dependent methyltransferase [Sandaracinaceae bacterium]|nr:class I SAM-dependent methyltransferase [Sandaracinaceae bacterium]
MIRVVHEDDDLIAVDKPPGVPCQSADPAHPDDLPHRLRLARGLAYVGVHQRLDEDTSGVILYAKRPEANAGLAAQFEGRRVDKRYEAIVTGWRGGPRRLEHQLARRGERVEVVGAGDRRGKRAITRVERVERHGERARLTIAIETGRTHQIRAQLAAEGAPIDGDLRYGGADAPRLLLHASRLALAHPIGGAPLALDAPPPPLFDAWLTGAHDPFAPHALDDALERATERRWGLAQRSDLDAFRLLDAAGDGVPGVTIDRYAGWWLVSLYDEGAAHSAAVLDAIARRGEARGVYVKRRPRQANLVGEADAALAPPEPVRGEPAPSPLAIVEDGVPYLVRLGDGLSTGLFLDQRLNRARVRASAGGARVLNLFCYTAGFTVAAALGGARESLSLDASASALARAEENLRHAGLSLDAHRLSRRDCFEALRRLAKRGERFDLVVLDPPTYSTTKKTRWASGKGWVGLARDAFAVLSPGGALLACSNDRRMTQDVFRHHVRDGAREAGVTLARLDDLARPRDFPDPRGPKALLARRA